MLFTFFLLAASLAASTLAVPPLLRERQSNAGDESFSIYANASSLFEGLRPINGNGLGLWIGKPTIDGCPSDLVCTEHQNTTVFWSNKNFESARSSQVHMDVAVAGGQILYYDLGGVVKYTAAGENSIPSVGISRTYGIYYGPQDNDESTPDWGHLGLYSAQFHACPTDDPDVYFIKVVGVAIDPGNCTYIEVLGTRYSLFTYAAFSYV